MIDKKEFVITVLYVDNKIFIIPMTIQKYQKLAIFSGKRLKLNFYYLIKFLPLF